MNQNWVKMLGSSRYRTAKFGSAPAHRETTLSRILGQYAYAILSALCLRAFRVWILRGLMHRVIRFVGGTLENSILLKRTH